ncbi:MAG: 3-phosphoshikimate 1-carboxyvinyltransferase [Anaerolineae bacterium]|nr:3-phosphoshikimate 1-carboxyvinyltransferase [Anaerolineae bacterium]
MHTATEYLTLQPSGPLHGTTTVPGDKSISHRAVLFNSFVSGTSTIHGWLPAGDTEATLNAVRGLGIRIEQPQPTTLIVHGGDYTAPQVPLNLVNAGTGIRLLAGILAGQSFASTLDGSAQLRRRPMGRVTTPLRAMGARITDREGFAPLHFEPASLRGIHYPMPVASAQVKSAILLAGLFAEGPTTITQPGPARDHTERLLGAMGAKITQEGDTVTLTPGQPLHPLDLTIPGDFSSAAFLLVAASLLEGSAITLTNISLNPTRTGLLDALQAMGAAIEVQPQGASGGDPVGTLVVQSAPLCGAEIGGALVVRMIDEFPALMIAALHAEGRTIVREARELRVKETDRIAVMAGELRKMGASIEEREDGFVIEGPQPLLHGTLVEAHDDHRVAMSLALAGMLAQGTTQISGAACIRDSFPGFEDMLRQLGATLQ